MSERAWCILHNELAPSHGRITQDVHKKIDDKLKKLNVGTFKKISQLDNSWTSVQRAIMQYDFVTPEGNLVERVDKMVEGGFDCPKFSDPAFTDKVNLQTSQIRYLDTYFCLGSRLGQKIRC